MFIFIYTLSVINPVNCQVYLCNAWYFSKLVLSKSQINTLIFLVKEGIINKLSSTWHDRAEQLRSEKQKTKKSNYKKTLVVVFFFFFKL